MNKDGDQKGKGRYHGMVFGVVLLVGLMLAGSYWGVANKTQSVSAQLSVQRVLLELEESAEKEPEEKEEEAQSEEDEKGHVNGSSSAAVVAKATTDFTAYRQTLAKSREEAASLLEEVIGNDAAGGETIQQALRQKTELARTIEMETQMETLLKARGFEDALCTLSHDAVNIVVKAEELTQQQASQILHIAQDVSGQPAANIRIIPSI